MSRVLDTVVAYRILRMLATPIEQSDAYKRGIVDKDGDKITIEPPRAAAFPVIKDLVVDRSAFDRIIESGGYVSVKTGSAQEANARPIEKVKSDLAFD